VKNEDMALMTPPSKCFTVAALKEEAIGAKARFDPETWQKEISDPRITPAH
jgi:hypothetical protein